LENLRSLGGFTGWVLPLEPKGDIMRVVQFSIKPIQIPNFWMGWSGEIDQNN
jgi:hypothetical protein